MCKNGWTDQFAVWVVDLDGPNEAQAELYSPGGANVPDDTLLWAVQKQLNQSICRLGCGLGCAQGSASSIVFARWHQCAQDQLYSPGGTGASTTWQIPLNRLSVVAMRPYVKLLWPLVIIIFMTMSRMTTTAALKWTCWQDTRHWNAECQLRCADTTTQFLSDPPCTASLFYSSYYYYCYYSELMLEIPNIWQNTNKTSTNVNL